MIDFHSHLLPEMDDGSKSTEESFALLEAAYSQGVEAIFSTPHFYPKRDDPDSFLRRRERSLKKLYEKASDDKIKIPLYVGAEVAYFYGMSRYEKLRDFCLGGTDYILIEMPFDRWTSEEVEEIASFYLVSGLKPLIAHFERYLCFGNKKYLKFFLQNNVLIQSNAEFFINKKTRRKALSYLKKGMISVLGSDCHNQKERPENYGEATKIISEFKKGIFLQQVLKNESTIMKGAASIKNRQNNSNFF